MPISPDEFQSLVARARQGDQEAMTTLLREYEREIRIAARVHLGPALRQHVDESDLLVSVQGSLLRCLRGDHLHLSSPEHLLNYARRMTWNKAALAYRKTHRQQQIPAEELETLLLGVLSRERDPAKAAEGEDLVRSFVNRLKDNERHVIKLRLLDYSTVETARILGRNADVIRADLSRMRERLRGLGLPEELLRDVS